MSLHYTHEIKIIKNLLKMHFIQCDPMIKQTLLFVLKEQNLILTCLYTINATDSALELRISKLIAIKISLLE